MGTNVRDLSVRVERRAQTWRNGGPGAEPAYDRGMPSDAPSIARKTKLGAASRPAVLEGSGPAGLGGELAHVIGHPVSEELDGMHDWILFFAPDRAALEAQLPAAATALDSPGTLWIAYPKGSSKRQTDLTRDKGWDALKDQDLMWLSLISFDDDWSAFSLRRYKPGEARQTFR
jgi:hypothetical protein